MASEPNSNCKVKLIILDAKFLKDADVWGKQDPFIQFHYDGRLLKTAVKPEAGKEATWNEEFVLEDIAREIAAGGKLRLEALDEDTLSNDWIGATLPIPYTELVGTADVMAQKLEFLDKGGNEVGHVNVSTQYIWAEPPPPAPIQSISPEFDAGASRGQSNYDEEGFEDSAGKKGPANPDLDKKSILKIIIKEASFLKDSDFFGK